MISLRKLRITLIGFIIMTYLVIILNSYHIFDSQPSKSMDSSKKESLHKLVRVLVKYHKSLKFFEENTQNVNLDGLFGLRISQGIFSKLAHQNIKNKKLNNLIRILNERIHSLAEKITKEVAHKTPIYYTTFKALITKPFLENETFKSAQIQLRTDITREKFKDIGFNEKFSDTCYSLLLNENENQSKCDTSNQCLQFFTDQTASAYYLTHQLIYFMLARHIGCTSSVMNALIEYLINIKSNDLVLKIFSSLNTNLNIDYDNLNNEILGYICTKIYHETQEIFVNYTDQKSMENDLFIEQNVLCGLLDIKEFLNDDYLNLIYTFQQSNGCFGGDTFSKKTKNEKIYKIDDLLNQLKSNIPKKRTKRYDTRMKDGCSSHETGLGLAYYSLMIKSYLNEFLN